MSLRTSLDEVLEADSPLGSLNGWVWHSLSEASGSSLHPWNLGYFSTVEVDDSGATAPRTRTVVVRAVDAENKTLDFFTDVRSTKVEQLRFDSGSEEVCWLFYSPATKIQLRLEGVAALIGGEEAEVAWTKTPVPSRAAYVSIATPGVEFKGEAPPDTSDRQVNEEQSQRGRENFRIVRTSIRIADLLYLRESGHVRARVEYPGRAAEDVQATNYPEPLASWVVP